MDPKADWQVAVDQLAYHPLIHLNLISQWCESANEVNVLIILHVPKPGLFFRSTTQLEKLGDNDDSRDDDAMLVSPVGSQMLELWFARIIFLVNDFYDMFLDLINISGYHLFLFKY